jgi:hypothetical protein
MTIRSKVEMVSAVRESQVTCCGLCMFQQTCEWDIPWDMPTTTCPSLEQHADSCIRRVKGIQLMTVTQSC